MKTFLINTLFVVLMIVAVVALIGGMFTLLINFFAGSAIVVGSLVTITVLSIVKARYEVNHE